MLPATSARVPMSTSPDVNRQIQEDMQDRVSNYRNASAAEITDRLWELDREWDIERTLEANAAMACLVGVALGATVDRRIFYLPMVIGGFLLQHALQGWCPPLPVFRRLGIRTEREIDGVRFALKAIGGDFHHLANYAAVGRRMGA
ncbi:MAG: DUF2892 domain-containing protein [Planctomycetaceae bacterium]|nr:DUF2892 domain-containing protein [Planctomycetaceae bacterium]